MEKVYVQDLLLIDSEKIFQLIDKMEATILIAGSSKRMPQDVLAILEKIVRQNLFRLGTDDQDLDKLSSDYVKNLEKMKRIQLETWS
jgi:sulfite reductase alpha subunit-like flavoprotein